MVLFAIINDDFYQPWQEPRNAAAGLAGSALAAGCLAVSIFWLIRDFRPLGLLMRLAVIALDAIVTLLLAGTLLVAAFALIDYGNGVAAFDAALGRCGHEPILAEDYGRIYIVPGSSEYARLKISVGEWHIFGPNRYVCSDAEARSQGFHPWNQPY